MERRPGTTRRLWAFRLTAAVVLPLALLLGLELLLRAAGYGDASGFTVPCTVGEVPSACDNPRFTWRFFPPRIARTAPSFAFPVEEAEPAYRIFVLGGSAAQGDPEPTYGVARMLEVLLAHRYPGARVEVVNAAVTAINSHVVRVIAGDLAAYRGDLYVVYLGNNEVVGPYGPGSVFSSADSLGLIRSSIFLRGTRLGQLLSRAAAAAASGEDPSEWRGMEFFLERRIRHDDPRLEGMATALRDNLEAITEAATASGAGVFLSTVATNMRDSAPFASQHGQGLTADRERAWKEAFERGGEAEAVGRTGEAEAAYREAAGIDPDVAELAFRLGRVLLAAGRHEEAHSAFLEARELDTLRFRADRRINETIRSVAADRAGNGVHLLDADKLFREAAPDGTPGAELFLDHVHLNFRGNFLLAGALFRKLEPLLPERVRSHAVEGPPLTEQECQARLAFTAFDRHRVASLMLARMNRPPFTNQTDHEERVRALENEVAARTREASPNAVAQAAETYRLAIGRSPADPWLHFNHAALAAEAGEHALAAYELRVFLERLPQDVQARERLASSLAELGKFEEAVTECRVLIDRAPHLPTSYYTLAYALANLGRLDECLATYRELLEVDPEEWEKIYNEIGRIEIHRGRFDAAIAAFEEASGRNETSGGRPIPDIYYNHAFALKSSGRHGEARAMYARAAGEYRDELAENEGSVALRLALGGTLVEIGEMEEASRLFREAANLEPGNPAAWLNLVQSLEVLGRGEEAAEARAYGVRALTDAGRVADAERLRSVP